MAEEIITSTNVETATDHEYNASEIHGRSASCGSRVPTIASTS